MCSAIISAKERPVYCMRGVGMRYPQPHVGPSARDDGRDKASKNAAAVPNAISVQAFR